MKRFTPSAENERGIQWSDLQGPVILVSLQEKLQSGTGPATSDQYRCWPTMVSWPAVLQQRKMSVHSTRRPSARSYPGGPQVTVRSCRSGFTLTEMLLVLGVIVAFAGMTVPSVMKMFQQQKLTGGAEKVRGAIASARFRAIESGLIYQFCCEPNGTRFVVVPFEPDHMSAKTGGGSSGPVTLLGRASGTLPNGLKFSSISARTSTSSTLAANATAMTTSAAPSHKLPAGSFDGLPNAGDLASASWSPPVLFHPEGSANADIEIKVSDTKGQFVRLTVRAFTGAVSMDRVVAGGR